MIKSFITNLLRKNNYDKTRLLDIFWAIQDKYNYVSPECLKLLGKKLNLSIPELKDTLTFYHFFHERPSGIHRIYVDTSTIAEMKGGIDVWIAFQKELGIFFGEMTEDGQVGLYETSCIGMSDQSPAALIDMIPVTNLTPTKVKKIVKDLLAGKKMKSNVKNNVFKKGPVFFGAYKKGESLEKIKNCSPRDIIGMIKESGLRGRGGAGFPTGLKWEMCFNQKETTRYIVCNADEGEPGTFKDRFLLMKKPQAIIEGMILAGFALGAKEGLIYLRAEYRYLLNDLNKVLQEFRKKKLLGKNILNQKGFNFDIRIVLGAGAYVVGEETALLESLEGRRGEPRVRPPFPVECGYLGKPTIVNNVETFFAVSQIINNGVLWYQKFGSGKSIGTKLLSVSGDVKKPGIYEIEWGLKVGDLLKLVEAQNPLALQVGGPSGNMISSADVNREISFEDLPTGGSIMVFSKERNLLAVVKNFIQFFVNESCGACLPCRAGAPVLNEKIDFIISGKAAREDLDRIKTWSNMISKTSRCGLGQTCSNPLITSMEAFPELYHENVLEQESGQRPFDLEEKLQEYEEVIAIHEEIYKP